MRLEGSKQLTDYEMLTKENKLRVFENTVERGGGRRMDKITYRETANYFCTSPNIIRVMEIK